MKSGTPLTLSLALFSVLAHTRISNASECEKIYAGTERNLILSNPAYLPSGGTDFNAYFRDESNRKDLHWVLANVFFDRDAIAMSPVRESDHLTESWNESSYLFFTKSPFADFEEGYTKFILDSDQLARELSLPLIQEFHHQLMHRGFEGTSGSDAGVIRKTSVGFTVLKSQWPHLHLQLTEYPYLKQVSKNADYGRVEYPDAKDVTPLLTAAIDEHYQAVAMAQNQAERVRAHTDFVWKFISIHPFVNGNGRTSRFILDFLISKEGLSPPLLSDTEDLEYSPARYFTKVMEGVRTTEAFVNDLRWRRQEGLDIKQTPFNLASKLPRYVWLKSEATGVKKAPVPVDLYDYAQFVRDQPRDSYSYAPQKETDRLRKYVAWVKKWSVQFKTSQGEVEPAQVRRVPQEMIDFWCKQDERLQTSDGIKTYEQTFYESSLLYRGVSLNHSMSDSELIDYFKRVQGIHLSMNAGGARDKSAAIISDLKKFNQLMSKPKELFRYVTDHMNAEGLYRESIFNSTAKVPNVADRFARGFMMSPEWIKGMKGQLLIGALRPKYGVMDLNRLREISSQVLKIPFKSQFPRQQEVSVAGAIHPASMMRVEFRDVKVLEAVQNSGEWIAGETEILLRRVLERVEDDPAKIKISKYDGAGNLISERLVDLTQPQT